MVKAEALFTRRYWSSLVRGSFRSKNYKDIRTYCMFIGYQRSGHSYIGALLDAHPHTAMGMEVDALNLVEQGFSRNQLYYCLENNARIFNRVLKNVWTGYSYAVPGGSQGRYNKLRVIGDKKGGRSTLRLGENLKLYDRLTELTGVPIKIIHVIRNPFDNIGTMWYRYQEKGFELTAKVKKDKIDYYFKKVDINQRLKNDNKYDIIDIYHEDFVANPNENLESIIRFIGLENIDGYIAKCASTTYSKPNKSRHKVEWAYEEKQYVQHKIGQYPFLSRYCYDG